jgi:hypothetical protein
MELTNSTSKHKPVKRASILHNQESSAKQIHLTTGKEQEQNEENRCSPSDHSESPLLISNAPKFKTQATHWHAMIEIKTIDASREGTSPAEDHNLHPPTVAAVFACTNGGIDSSARSWRCSKEDGGKINLQKLTQPTANIDQRKPKAPAIEPSKIPAPSAAGH